MKTNFGGAGSEGNLCKVCNSFQDTGLLRKDKFICLDCIMEVQQ